MKQIGVLKKTPTSWALTRSKADGVFRLDYNGTGFYLRGKRAEVEQSIADASVFIFNNPDRPEEIEGSGHVYSWHDKSVPQEWRDADDAKRFRDNDIRTWDQKHAISLLELFDKHPVFEDTLVFSGYSKGQSSFTLNFRTSNEQIIRFGPKFTGQLVEMLIQHDSLEYEDVLNVPAGENVEYNQATGEYDRSPAFFTGKAVRLRFTFTKQGENIYAQPLGKEDAKLWQPLS